MKIRPTLPPTAAPVPFRSLVAGMAALFGTRDDTGRLTRELQDRFGVEHVFLVSSGKSALTLILRGLHRLSRRRKVVIPAYTCYSVPSAVLKAGLETVPSDISPATLDFVPDRLGQVVEAQTLCVLATHLFGLPADVDHVKELCGSRGVFVVEDAAQSMGGTSKGRWLGTIGDVGFFSLGRGKNISSGGGGVILTRSAEIAKAIKTEYEMLPTESTGSEVKNLAELAATSALIHPNLYWFPAGLPFLGLGETRFYSDFPIERMSNSRAATLRDWPRRLGRLNLERRQRAEELVEELRRTSPEVRVITAPEASYLRLPILVRDYEVKHRLLTQAAAMGLGLSPGYPGPIRQIPELQGRLGYGDDPGAQEVVDRLVTLPTHRFVRAKHCRSLCRLIRELSAAPASVVPKRNCVAHEQPGAHATSRP